MCIRDRIKISIIGQSAFGESVAEEILKMNGTIISSIFSSSNPKDPLNQFGLENDLPVRNFKRLRDNEAIESFKSFDVDLLVMAYVTDIVPMEIIKSPRLGTIQYHPSLLPLHRGPSSINWAIINGDKKTGISIFWPDEGLDTGPILLQKEVEIDKSGITLAAADGFRLAVDSVEISSTEDLDSSSKIEYIFFSDSS